MSDTISQLVKVAFRDKFPSKSELEISRLTDQTLSGKIDEWIWVRILDRMFDEDDCRLLAEEVKALTKVPAQA